MGGPSLPGNATSPALSTSADGTAVAAWAQSSGSAWTIWGSHFDTTGVWRPPARLDNGSANAFDPPLVAADSAGRAMAVWSEFEGGHTTVHARSFDPQTGWANKSTRHSNVAFRAELGDFDGSGSGEAAAVWLEHGVPRTEVWAARFSQSSGWHPPERVALDTSRNISGPTVSVNASGTVTVVWLSPNNTRAISPSHDVLAARYEPGTGWSVPTVVDATSGPIYGGSAISHSDGADVFFVWSQYETSTFRSRIRAAQFTPAAGWSAASKLEPATGPSSQVPAVAVDLAGRALATWWKFSPNSSEMWMNRFDPAVGWGNATRVGGGLVDFSSGSPAAVDEGGNLTLAFRQGELRSFHYRPGTGWFGPAVASREGGGSTVAALPAGGAILVWMESDGARSSLRWSRFVADTAPPAIQVSAPASSDVPYARVTGLTEPGSTFAIGGTYLAVLTNGSFEGLVPLSPGVNALTCLATDLWGNTAQLNISVVYTDPFGAALLSLSRVSAELNTTGAELAAKDAALREALDQLAVLNETLLDLNVTQVELATAYADALALQTRVGELLAKIHQLDRRLNDTESLYSTALQNLAAREAALNSSSSELSLAETGRNLAFAELASAKAGANATAGALNATRASLESAVADLDGAHAEATRLSIRLAELAARNAEREARAAAEASSLHAEAEAARSLGWVLLVFGALFGAALGIHLSFRRAAL